MNLHWNTMTRSTCRPHRSVELWTLLVVLAFAQTPVSADEPTYEGRTLSSWLSDFNFGRIQDTAKNEAATRAVEAIGVEAVPVLVERLTTTSAASKQLVRKVRILRSQGSLETQEKFEEESNLVGSSLIEDINTLAAFRILGAKAKPAIPELIEILGGALNGTIVTQEPAAELDDRKSRAAAKALAAIGPDAVPPLVEALNSEEAKIRFGAAMALPYFPHNLRIVEALTKTLQDRDSNVRWRALRSLGRYRVVPQATVTAIASRLSDDPDSGVRYYAIVALKQYGPMAQSALPDIIKAANDSSWAVREKAIEALDEVRPVEAPR